MRIARRNPGAQAGGRAISPPDTGSYTGNRLPT